MTNDTTTRTSVTTNTLTINLSSTVSARTVPTTEALSTEAGNESTTTVTPEYTTQTETFCSTINATEVYKHENTENESSGAIIGGCVGAGVTVLLVLVIVLLVIKWKRRRRKTPIIPTLPGKDFLDTLHTEHAVRHHRANQPIEPEDVSDPDNRYVNLKRNGETDERTDPSVGSDGYLKKTKNFFFSLKKHKKQKKDQRNATKEQAKRTDSMPYDHAPPPPTDSAQYAEGRVAENTSAYANLQSQSKGDNAFWVEEVAQKNNKNKGTRNGKKGKKAKNVSENELKALKADGTNEIAQPELKETQQLEVYENIDHGNYYNLKGNGQQEPSMRPSFYENCESKTDNQLQQDDVYENP